MPTIYNSDPPAVKKCATTILGVNSFHWKLPIDGLHSNDRNQAIYVVKAVLLERYFQTAVRAPHKLRRDVAAHM